MKQMKHIKGQTRYESTQRGKKTKEREHIKEPTSTLSKKTNQKGCPRRKNVGLDLVYIVPLYWSTDDICAIMQNS